MSTRSNLQKFPPWLIPVSLLCALMGFMFVVTANTINPNFTGLSPDLKDRLGQRGGASTPQAAVDQKQLKDLQEEVKQLRVDKTKLENALANQNKDGKLLNESLQQIKAYAGLTEIEGPGVVVTLKDYKGPDKEVFSQDRVIHDVDVLRVSNELWNAGAEAIEVNGQRLSVRTSLRCVGSTILANDVKIASPVMIRAIGDSQTLMGAMTMPGGIRDEIQNLGHPSMFEITTMKAMRLNAYSGLTTYRIGTVPKTPTQHGTNTHQ